MKVLPKVQVENNEPGQTTSSGGSSGPPKVWRITGRVLVRETEIDTDSNKPRERPLAGIEVKVSASDIGGDGPWTHWGTVRTDADGDFLVAEENSGHTRFFRVQARLSSADLEVNDSVFDDVASFDLLDENWRTIWKSDGQLTGPDVSVGNRVFGGSGFDLGNETFRRQALIWYLLRTTIDRFEEEDSWFAMNGRIAAIYPAHTPSKTAYANGLTRMIYLATGNGDNAWRPDTVLHEFMHLWNYDHNYGTINWLNAVCSLRMSNPIDGTTHALQENPVVAFAEGFSMWASAALLHELWEGRRNRPYNRRYVAEGLKLTTLEMVERSEYGVETGLRLLHVGDRQGWWSHLFGTIDTYPENLVNENGDSVFDHPDEVGVKKRLDTRVVPPRPHNLSLWDIMRTFRATPSAGWDHDLEVGNRDYGIVRFIDRAVDIHGLGETARLMLKRSIDPLATDEPYQALDKI